MEKPEGLRPKLSFVPARGENKDAGANHFDTGRHAASSEKAATSEAVAGRAGN
jgi:hypothetical protein